jgi:hypothetical protein
MRVPDRVLLLLLVSFAGSSTPAVAQECSGFPWTVTATPAGGKSVSIGVCGTYAGCHPHNPRFAVEGGEILVYLTQAELSECICLAVVGDFRQNIMVSPVDPGDYTVKVVDLNCGEQLNAGQTTLALPASSAIPVLDRRGAAALVVLTALTALGVLKLRG